jgi:hypothetical protein
MKALTNINAPSLADAVAAAGAAAARDQAFAFSGGGTDLIQQIKDGTNQADVLINLRTVREARAVVVSPTETRIGGLITLRELAEHAALTAPWTVLREAAASVECGHASREHHATPLVLVLSQWLPLLQGRRQPLLLRAWRASTTRHLWGWSEL